MLASSTARAVLFSALTTILTFCSLAFASHRGLASFGRPLTIGVSLTLVCYVVVLPAVLAWGGGNRRRGGMEGGRRGAARGAHDRLPCRCSARAEREAHGGRGEPYGTSRAC